MQGGILDYLSTYLSSFYMVPNFGESDLRSTYSVFVLCSLLNCWDAINTGRALSFIQRCRVSEFHLLLGMFSKLRGNRPTRVVTAKTLIAKHKVGCWEVLRCQFGQQLSSVMRHDFLCI